MMKYYVPAFLAHAQQCTTSLQGRNSRRRFRKFRPRRNLYFILYKRRGNTGKEKEANYIRRIETENRWMKDNVSRGSRKETSKGEGRMSYHILWVDTLALAQCSVLLYLYIRVHLHQEMCLTHRKCEERERVSALNDAKGCCTCE